MLENPLLRSLPSDSAAVRRFLDTVEILPCRRGEILYAEGDRATSFYLVRHGEIHRFHRETDGSDRLIGIHGRGSVLGEVSFLARERHGARAVAVLDSEILVIRHEHWLELAQSEPDAQTGLVRILSRRFHRSLDPNDQLVPARIHIIAYPDNTRRGQELAAVLSSVLCDENHGPVLLFELDSPNREDVGSTAKSGEAVPSRALDSPVGLLEWLRSRSNPGGAPFDRIDASLLVGLEGEARKRTLELMPALLGLLRKYYSLVLVHVGRRSQVADGIAGAFYRTCDHIVCVRDAAVPAGPAWIDYRRRISLAIPDFFDRLISVSEEHYRAIAQKERYPDRGVPLKQNRIRLSYAEDGTFHTDASGIHRLARKLSGTLRGLSLGGGGARAYAHAGVLEALEERGLEFDGISGTSMGAVIGAAHAAGLRVREIKLLLKKHLPDSNAIFDKGLPLVSFFRGRRLNQVLTDVFADLQFEDLRIPFYCNSTDLNSGRSVIFESGYISTALRASVSLPGLFPPLQIPPYSLVDGGILNNLAGDILRSRGFSRVVGVNVTPMEDDRSSQTSPDFSEGVEGLFDYFRRPPVLSIITRSIAVEGRELLRSRLADFDFILNPEIGSFDLFDFHRHDEIFAAGRREAANRMEDLAEALARTGTALD